MSKLSMLFVCLAGALAAQGGKQYKSQAEYQLYDSAAKAIAANDFPKALAALDTWKRDFADSDYQADRQFLYVLAYAGAKQPAKAIDAAGNLLARPDLESVLPSPANRVRLLFTAAAAIQGYPGSHRRRAGSFRSGCKAVAGAQRETRGID